MHFVHFNLHFIIVFCLLIFFATKANCHTRINDGGGKIAKTIVVDQKGQGNFKTVQEAVDSIPSNNNLWTQIYVKAGHYKEKVTVPRDKPYIFLQGEGQKATIINWEEAGDSPNSATFTVEANNFVAAKLSFVNTYNVILPLKDRNPILRASAANIWGDKASFYHCSFFSLQDTLTDAQNRHYFESCYIQGAVDFIWGFGQSVYQNCVINATTAILNGVAGYITAQGRSSKNDTSGFVFNKACIVGDGPVYLGRAYRDYSRVVFKYAYMPDIVQPKGWSAWHKKSRVDLTTYVEVGCKGPRAKQGNRVKWEKKRLEPKALRSLTNVDYFINQDGWLQNQPKPQ